jgi:Ca2+-binding RTX toxin-like protein
MEEPMLARTTFVSTTTLTKTVLPIYPILPLVSEIYGTAGDDYGLYGTAGDDSIYGLAGNDSLYGMGGNDTLDGGAGNDVMAGGTGNDTYIVDSVNDVVWEWGGEGIDTVRATINNAVYTLPSAVENLVLSGPNASGGQGNELDNTMMGNDVYNVFYGGAGNDTLKGAGGNDSLYGDVGNDVLDGGTGSDLMQGGTGDDTYYVDSYNDQIFENFNSGIDTVRAKIGGYTLGENIENLILEESSTNAYGVGNSLDNTLRGNSTQNVLIGGGGFDTIFGGAGADTFKFTALGDAVRVGGFSDYIADFSAAEGDKIDLSAIDANVNAAGDQAFLFIGNNNAFVPSFGAGQLRFNGGFLEGDVNGDLVADFRIEVNAPPLPDGAFIL